MIQKSASESRRRPAKAGTQKHQNTGLPVKSGMTDGVRYSLFAHLIYELRKEAEKM
jgi:hypothetical protein